MTSNAESALRAIIVIAVLQLLMSHALACTCVPNPPPCVAFRNTPSVFVGLVTSVDEEKTEFVRFGKKETIRIGLTAHFVVEEALKGVTTATVDVQTGGGGGDCGYHFERGERYLVYAYPSEGGALSSTMSMTVLGGRASVKANALRTSICTRTRPLAEATDDIELIRALSAGSPQTRIFGVIAEYFDPLVRRDSSKFGYAKPFPNVVIKARGVDAQYEAKSGADGIYRIINPKTGAYHISVEYPEHYGAAFKEGPVNVEVTTQTCSAEALFWIQIDGRISGRVFNPNGKPVGKDVQVSIVSADSSGKGLPFLESRSAYTDSEGRYSFNGVAPGTFILGVNIANVPFKQSPYDRIYYPSVSESSKARIITLTTGQKVEGLDLHLSRQLNQITITGYVVRANGARADKAHVSLYDTEDPEREVFGFEAETDSRGRFVITCFKGRRYKLHAYLSKDYFVGTGVQSEDVDIKANANLQNVKIVLNKKGIFRERRN